MYELKDRFFFSDKAVLSLKINSPFSLFSLLFSVSFHVSPAADGVPVQKDGEQVSLQLWLWLTRLVVFL